MKKQTLFQFRHLFLACVILFIFLQAHWMAERQNYKDAVLRVSAAPIAACVVCFIYGIFFQCLARLLRIDFPSFIAKAESLFFLLYGSIFLVFFPYAYENILFYVFVAFVLMHVLLLARLTPHRLAENILLFFAFSALSFVCMEMMLRTFQHIKPSFIFASTSYDRFRRAPHSYHFDFKLNAGGFSDVEFTTEKRANVTRIAGLGDSFLFGLVPYKHNFFTRLEGKLNASERKWELLNMGLHGMSLDDYYNLLVREALPLKPDGVICHVFVGNDFKNYYTLSSYSTSNLFHYREWYLYKLADYIFHIKPKFKGRITDGKTVFNEQAEYVDRETFLRMKWDWYHGFDKTLNLDAWYESSLEILLKMKALLDKNNVFFLVVLIPDELQVNTALQKEFMQFAENKKLAPKLYHTPSFDFNLPQKKIKKALLSRSIDLVDLLAAFKKEAESGKPLYLPNDNHWNIAGNQIAADVLYEELQKKLKADR